MIELINPYEWQKRVVQKYVYYKETANHKIGEIVNGYLREDKFVCLHKKEGNNLYWMAYPPEYPIMPLSEWRDNQIDSILDD